MTGYHIRVMPPDGRDTAIWSNAVRTEEPMETAVAMMRYAFTQRVQAAVGGDNPNWEKTNPVIPELRAKLAELGLSQETRFRFQVLDPAGAVLFDEIGELMP